MRQLIHCRAAVVAGSLALLLPLAMAAADDSTGKPQKVGQSKVKNAKPAVTADKPPVKDDKNIEETNLIDAMRDGVVSVTAEGIGDGRMTLSVTNQTNRQLRVILPPGLIARSGATGAIRRYGRHGAAEWAAE